MLFNHDTFIGIDPTAGQRPITYAVLDVDLQLLALGHGNIDDVLAYTAGQQLAFVAVCAPRQPNQGLMAKAEVRDTLNPSPAPGRWMGFRLLEYQLSQHNLHIPRTPGKKEKTPNWMQTSFNLFRRLEILGYRPYPAEGSERQSLEVYPHASFASLLELIPLPKTTIEGRLQRQLILHDCGVGLPDPMRFFEEITRFRILKGIWPLEDLYSPAELDAMVGAYTAWKAAVQPDKVCRLGDPAEGEIVLPVKALQQRYA